MRFTEHEMVFFNSITKGDSVFGIPLKFRPENSHEEEVKNTINGLMGKGVLKSETELSVQGAVAARALECYKESTKHVIINYLHIAFLEKKDAVVIVPLKNREYELLRLPRAALFYLLLEQYPVLRNAAKEVNQKIELEDMDAFLQELKKYDGNIMVGEFQQGTLVREQVCFWKEERIYWYDLNRQVRKEMNTVQTRRELLKLLEINEEVEQYGRAY